jgi:hypothetical protein
VGGFQTPAEKWTGVIEKRNQETRAEVPAAAFNEGMKRSLRIAHVNALLLDRSAEATIASFVAFPLPLLRQPPLLHTRDITMRRSFISKRSRRPQITDVRGMCRQHRTC